MQDLFDTLASLIRAKYSDSYIIGEQYSSKPPKFPSVSIVEENETVNDGYSTFDKKENVTSRTVYIEIYGTFDHCEDIAHIIDGCLSETYRYSKTLNQSLATGDNIISRRVMRFVNNNII